VYGFTYGNEPGAVVARKLLATRMRAGEIATCTPVFMEVTHKADSPEKFEEIAEHFAELVWLSCPEEATNWMARLHREFAHIPGMTHRQVPIPDVMIVACAWIALQAGEDLVVWHRDKHIGRSCHYLGIPHEAQDMNVKMPGRRDRVPIQLSPDESWYSSWGWIS
jgi:predicted nucleic acid-binding protein